jgi:hypothetical protein
MFGNNSDVDRRTVGNLAIPRNVEDLCHVLRVDPYSPTRSEDEVHDHLKDLADRGLVVRLGSFDGDPTGVVTATEKNKKALTLPEDSARILSQRLARPERAWRLKGDMWIVSEDGVRAMHEPVVEAPAKTPSEVQALVDAEWSRTLKGVTVDNYDEKKHGSLASKLLEDEFLAWAKPVAAECKRVWNHRIALPLAGGAGWTDVYENFILDHENQKTSLATNDPITAPWFMALSIFAYTDADTGATHGDATRLPTYTGYAAKSVAAADMPAASAGSSANTTAITFAACTAGSSAIIGFGNNSVVTNTSGIFRKYGACSSTTVSTTQTPATFAVGAYTTTAD